MYSTNITFRTALNIKFVKTMYNHESRKLNYNLCSMHYINIHNNSTVTGTTNRTNPLLQVATNSTINPIRIIFPEQDTSQIQISRDDKVYCQLHQLVFKTRKLVATCSHNPIYIQHIQSRPQIIYEITSNLIADTSVLSLKKVLSELVTCVCHATGPGVSIGKNLRTPYC
jgi:hypothetical protein